MPGSDIEDVVENYCPPPEAVFELLGVSKIHMIGEISEQLGDNYCVDVGVVLWEGSDVLRVPSSALFRQGDEWGVFVVDALHAGFRSVEIGHRSPSCARVLDGVEAGEKVLLHPPNSVADGTRVAYN